jgi:hypothetical protein
VGVSEQGAEENILTSEGGITRGYSELHNEFHSCRGLHCCDLVL